MSDTQELNIQILNSLDGAQPLPEFVSAVPITFARKHGIIAVSIEGNDLAVVGDEASLSHVQTLSRLLNRPLKAAIAGREIILRQINFAYQQRQTQRSDTMESLVPAGQSRDAVLDEVRRVAIQPREDLLDTATRAPVIKVVNLMLFDAVQAGASDVHVQPYEQDLVVRHRIDGILYDTFTLPKAIQDEVLSRIKVMGRMNIAEKRLPQDGRATVQLGNRFIDLRIASLPTSFGERIVIRLLDKSSGLFDLTELGMDAPTLKTFENVIKIEHGLVLVTGPTGSGKTTTLYSALRRLDTKQKNMLTLEDPIEYQLEGISQTQVSEKKGMTFASGLRSVLRQDPDVIMVGEIRDRETATMAIQSALTGHLVFSTLHTNDAASAVTRLLDLGIEPYLVASSLVAVLAQRLVRRVCEACAMPIELSAEERRVLGVANKGQPRIGAGCGQCRNTGYRGRVGLFELLAVSDPVRRLIQARATAADIRLAAIHDGMRTLRDDGIQRVLAGMTTLAEIERLNLSSSAVSDVEEDVI